MQIQPFSLIYTDFISFNNIEKYSYIHKYEILNKFIYIITICLTLNYQSVYFNEKMVFYSSEDTIKFVNLYRNVYYVSEVIPFA